MMFLKNSIIASVCITKVFGSSDGSIQPENVPDDASSKGSPTASKTFTFNEVASSLQDCASYQIRAPVASKKPTYSDRLTQHGKDPFNALTNLVSKSADDEKVEDPNQEAPDEKAGEVHQIVPQDSNYSYKKCTGKYSADERSSLKTFKRGMILKVRFSNAYALVTEHFGDAEGAEYGVNIRPIIFNEQELPDGNMRELRKKHGNGLLDSHIQECLAKYNQNKVNTAEERIKALKPNDYETLPETDSTMKKIINELLEGHDLADDDESLYLAIERICQWYECPNNDMALLPVNQKIIDKHMRGSQFGDFIGNVWSYCDDPAFEVHAATYKEIKNVLKTDLEKELGLESAYSCGCC